MRESLLPRLSVKRPISVLMFFCAILVVGAIAYIKLPISLFPAGFDPPFLWVWVSYRTSNPAEIEEQITRPVEEQLRTVRHLKDVYSNSRSDGAGFWLEFEKNTDMDVAYNQVYDRLERARAEMPDDQRYYRINRFSEDDDPVIYFSTSLKQTTDDPFYLIEEHIRKPLERIEGVAKVDIWGAYERIIQIELDAAKAKEHGVDLYRLIQSLRQDNFTLSSGWVKDAEKKLYVRSIGRFRTIEDIAKLPVKGPNLTLGHVAKITYDIPERRWFKRLNRQPAISVAVFKESTANTVSLCKKILSVIDNDIQQDPQLKGTSFEILFNQGSLILEAIENLKASGLWGAFFAFCVLFFFLRHWRMTFIIILAIPLSLLITIIYFFFIGWTLNIFTLMGMMICIGLVVDNAIVIAESIFLYKTRGLDPDQAAIQGSSEVALAVTLGTLTTVVVFVPLMLMNDDVGFAFYMLRIGMPVVIAILASLLVALLIIPLATKTLISAKAMKGSRLIDKTTVKYRRLLDWVLNRKFDVMLVGILIFFFSIGVIAKQVPKSDRAEGNIGDFRLMFRLPENYTEEKALAVVETVENLLYQKSEEYGLRAIDSRYSKTFAVVQAYLHPPQGRDLVAGCCQGDRAETGDLVQGTYG
ncbi:MAG: efflux RND transporter permease subunit, partial [bacterium]